MPEIPDTPEARRHAAICYGQFGADGYDEEGVMPQSGSQWGFSFMHVGARGYDPVTGRFLQRNPIGIEGGINVYEYARGSATSYIDAEGQAAFLVVLAGVVGKALWFEAGVAASITVYGCVAAEESNIANQTKQALLGKPAELPDFAVKRFVYYEGRYYRVDEKMGRRPC